MTYLTLLILTLLIVVTLWASSEFSSLKQKIKALQKIVESREKEAPLLSSESSQSLELPLWSSRLDEHFWCKIENSASLGQASPVQNEEPLLQATKDLPSPSLWTQQEGHQEEKLWAPHWTSLLFSRFKQERPMKLWAFVFLIGIIWFMSYAIGNNWITPPYRILLGMVVAIVLFVLGFLRMKKQATQGNILMGIGSGIYILSIFIGYQFFWFFGPGIGILLVLIQYLLMAILAYRSRSSTLIIMSFLYSAVWPFFLSFRKASPILLMSYFLLITIGYQLIAVLLHSSLSRLLPLVFYPIYFLIVWIPWLVGESLVSSIPFVIIQVSIFISLFLPEFLDIATKKYDRINLSFLWISFLYALIYWLFFVKWGTLILWSIGAVFFILWYLNFQKNDIKLTMTLFLIAIASRAGMLYLEFSWIHLTIAMTLLATFCSFFSLLAFREEKVYQISIFARILPIFSNLYLLMDKSWEHYQLLLFWLACLMLAFSANAIFQKLKNPDLVIFQKFLWFWALVWYIIISFSGNMTIWLLEILWLIVVLLTSFIQPKTFPYVLRNVFLLVPVGILLFSWGFSFWGMNLLTFVFFEALFALFFLAQYLELSQKRENWEEESSSVQKPALLIYGVVGLYCLYAGLASLVSMSYLSVSFLFLTVVLYVWLSRYKAYPISQYFAYLFWVPLLISLPTLFQDLSFSSFITYLLFACFALILKPTLQKHENLSKGRSYFFYAFFALYSFVLIWKGAYQYLIPTFAIAFSLISYVLVWLAFYTLWKFNNDKEKTILWTIVILGVIVRIFLVELWQMTLIGRIIVCVVIGALLLSSGYLKKSETPPKIN